MNDDLFKAILSMDVYHRGYNAGVTANGLDVVGRAIGTATFL